MSKKISPCAKIWEFINSVDEDYASNIEDICAKDLLSSDKALTVIIPDDKFKSAFKNNIFGSGNPSDARRMLMNTTSKHFFGTADDFSEYSSIPLRGGLTIKIKEIKEDNIVVLEPNIVITKCKEFKSPRTFNYAVWKVVSGEYPINTEFNIVKSKTKRDYSPSATGGKKKNKSSKSISGGGNLKQRFIVNLGKVLGEGSDVKRISLLTSIFTDYKCHLISKTKQSIDPLFIKGVSLMNWLSMYDKDSYELILPIIDISPAITIMMLIIDPGSPITNEHLFGEDDSTKKTEKSLGWRNSTITNNPYSDWTTIHLAKASKWAKSSEEMKKYFDNIADYRNNTVKDSVVIRKQIIKYYENIDKILQYAGDKPKQSLKYMYSDKNAYRKLWQDQFRMIALYGINDLATITFKSNNDVDDTLRDIILFRPLDENYEKAAAFSYEPGNYRSTENDYMGSKFFYSTNFGYMPDGAFQSDGKGFSIAKKPASEKPYTGELDGPVRDTINAHRINFEMLKELESRGATIPAVNPELIYGMRWHLQSAKERGISDEKREAELASLRDTFDKLTFGGAEEASGGKMRIGGDEYDIAGGAMKGLNKQRASKGTSRRRIIRRGSRSSSDDSDDNGEVSIERATFFT